MTVKVCHCDRRSVKLVMKTVPLRTILEGIKND